MSGSISSVFFSSSATAFEIIISFLSFIFRVFWTTLATTPHMCVLIFFSSTSFSKTIHRCFNFAQFRRVAFNNLALLAFLHVDMHTHRRRFVLDYTPPKSLKDHGHRHRNSYYYCLNYTQRHIHKIIPLINALNNCIQLSIPISDEKDHKLVPQHVLATVILTLV